MKTLKDFEKKIFNCSRCGLCQKVCPIYDKTKNETFLSRGLFVLLSGFLSGHLKMTKTLFSMLNNCIGCNACQEYCPSDINSPHIFNYAKYEYIKRQNCAYRFLYSEFLYYSLLKSAKICLNIYRFLKIDKLIKRFEPILTKSGFVGEYVLMLNYVAEIRTKRIKSKCKPVKKEKILYFGGCYNKYLNPSSKNATLNLLEALGYKVTDISYSCCGKTFFERGNVKAAHETVNTMLDKIPNDFDYIIVDYTCCEDFLKKYTEFADEKRMQKAIAVKNKTINVVDFLRNINFKSKNTQSYTTHKSCHCGIEESTLSSIIISNNYQKEELSEKCCGSCSLFFEPNLRNKLNFSKEKGESLLKSGAKEILGSCPLCLLNMKFGFLKNKSSTNPKSIVEFF